ncbi:aminotransferase-like domain-containing protein [Rhizobium rhizophilum]|uniref:aminotransferase-like domain-containing protein n=1 Tax=Rhizobium rhizophilum TaxID=1850373 RepID=UPI0014562B9D|nr:PLP-dependent aminotransferase family protein [Rhizobium rhizophilum]
MNEHVHPLQRSASRTGHVIADIRGRIGSGRLVPNDRLPSIRRLAVELSVSPSTVVEAYDRLSAEGLIRPRPGSGFFVTEAGRTPAPLVRIEPPRAMEVDPFWVARQALDADPGTSKPGCGWLPPDWMPTALLHAGMRNVLRQATSLTTDYGPSRGSAVLRRFVETRLRQQSITLAEDQVLLAGSATQALDLVCRLLLRPGDRVIVDDPCYFNFQTLLRAHQAVVVPVPYTENGPDIAAFEAAVMRETPRLYLTNSGLHNPTGATLSPQVVFQLLGIIGRSDMLVVEDDIFADFEPEPAITLATLDGLSRVLRIGSFSKTISASLRTGFIAADPEHIRLLTDLQVATQFGGPSQVASEAISSVLSSGGYRKHLDQLHRRLDKERRSAATRLGGLGMEPVLVPRGGPYLWCRMPDGISSTAIAQAALPQGVVLAPGNVFSPSLSSDGFMRFNVAHMGDARPFRVLERALENLRDRTALNPDPGNLLT